MFLLRNSKTFTITFWDYDYTTKSVYIKSVREPVGWGQETNFIWFGTSVQTMEHIFLPRELTVYNS
jgi:hypothetical protein